MTGHAQDDAHYVNPPQDSPSDDMDQLGWDVSVHGRMREHATTDDAVATEPWPGPGGDDA